MARKSRQADDAARFDPTTPIDPSRALVPAVQQVNEVRVRTGFWPKLTRTVGRVPFARELLSVYYCARDPETPAPAKGMMLAALAYFVLPTDAVPDVIAGLGFTDDAAVIGALISLVGANLKPRHRQAAIDALDRLQGD
jgi:uncharacterized membrane protein YkvA (DUF1232 family)